MDIMEADPSTLREGLLDARVAKSDADIRAGPEREQWSSHRTFLLAVIGAAIGLGNVWRFPFTMYRNGSGSFLIPYCLAVVFIGFPMLLLELSLGLHFRQGYYGCLDSIDPRLGGIALAGLTGGFIVVTYNAVVTSWVGSYFILSFESPLPWTADSESYFYDTVLRRASSIDNAGGNVNGWLVLALVLIWMVTYFSIFRGTKSAGKVVYITATFPVLFLFILMIRAATLDGAGTGIYAFINPDWKELGKSNIWVAAIGQVAFSFSSGQGIMHAFASYMPPKQDLIKDAVIISTVNCVVSLMSGFTVFSILGFMADRNNVTIDDVITTGPGLSFVVFPEALHQIFLPHVMSALFFLTILLLAVDTVFSTVEAVVTVLVDKFPSRSKPYMSLLVCVVAFGLGLMYVSDIGIYLLDLFDHYVTAFLLVWVIILQALVVTWTKVPSAKGDHYEPDREIFFEKLRRETITKDSRFAKYFGPHMKWVYGLVIPLSLMALFWADFIGEARDSYEDFPGWATAIGWTMVVLVLGIIPVWVIATVVRGLHRRPNKYAGARRNLHGDREQEEDDGYVTMDGLHDVDDGRMRSETAQWERTAAGDTGATRSSPFVDDDHYTSDMTDSTGFVDYAFDEEEPM